MPKGLQKIDFKGVMNVDVAPEILGEGSYTDASNISFLTNNTESTAAVIPMLGNEFAYDLGSVALQNKTWRVFTPQTAGQTGGLFIFDHNGNLISGMPVTWDRNNTLAAQ